MLTRRATAARRAGFTLVELLCSIVLMTLVGGSIVVLMLRQQRFYSSTNEQLETRQQIRQAAGMLPAALRGISSAGGDIYAMTDSSLEFRSVFGSSVACALEGKGVWVSTVPVNLRKQSALTAWSAEPAVDDSLAVYDDSTSAAETDDAWRFHRITSVTRRTGNLSDGCPTSSLLVEPGDVTGVNPSYKLTVSPLLSTTVTVGAAMRFFRRVHYSLYRASDGQWYLGYYDCQPNRTPVCNPIQPLAGPFQAYAPGATSGVQFAYYDSTGTATTSPGDVARISLVARGQGAMLLRPTGFGASEFRDSLRVEVGLRNRK